MNTVRSLPLAMRGMFLAALLGIALPASPAAAQWYDPDDWFDDNGGYYEDGYGYGVDDDYGYGYGSAYDDYGLDSGYGDYGYGYDSYGYGTDYGSYGGAYDDYGYYDVGLGDDYGYGAYGYGYGDYYTDDYDYDDDWWLW